MARLLGSGWLCSEGIFGCWGDDEALKAVLLTVATPDRSGWHESPSTGYYREYRWYGTTKDGERVYVSVRDTDPYEPEVD